MGYFNGLLEALSVCPGFDSRDVQSEVRKLVESKNIRDSTSLQKSIRFRRISEKLCYRCLCLRGTGGNL